MTKNLDISKPETPILIVDDNHQYTNVLIKILERSFGYKNITAVDSPQDAQRLLNEDSGRFKLLFVDYHFPDGETGGNLLKALRDKHILEQVVSFLITSEPNSDNVKEVQSLGVDGVVAKPFSRTALEQQLAKVQRSMSIDEDDAFVID
ncbi:MAG: response regulator [Bdellovibrionales bacterium]|nr:response regulator [Bdellovibrionales bacterium]